MRRRSRKSLTFVGTLEKKNSIILTEFLLKNAGGVRSTLYDFAKDITLVSHVAKRNKAVLLLSSMHDKERIDETKKKTEIIKYRNLKKRGIDEHDNESYMIVVEEQVVGQ